jgi:putative nucleotidyltransferase with HDIG domain
LEDINNTKPCIYFVANGKWKHLPTSYKYIIPSYKDDEIIKIINDVTKNNFKTTNNKSLSVDKIMLETANIPILPSIMMDLITISRDPEKTIRFIVDKIKMDQGLAAAILRLANSPIYTFSCYIDSIDRAIILLGFDEIKKLISAISVKPFFENNFKYYNESGLKLWLHSFNVAKICYDVAKSYNSKDINRESIYLTGLMHDIGQTILVNHLYKPVYTPQDEKDQTGYTHMEVGAIILKHWNVSEEIVESVLAHHSITHKLFNKVLYFANKREREDKINNRLKEETDKYFAQMS